MANTKIYSVEKSFDIGCKVVKWDEPGGLNFVSGGKYIKHNVKTHDELKKKIKQFTVHWSATYRAKHMYTGLNARGLSCNFMIDDDCTPEGYATIYQCLPIELCGYSQGPGLNALGPGVELSYQPQAWTEDWYDPNDRKKWDVPEHTSTTATVHGQKLKVHLPTKAQMNSLKALIWGFCELFPDVPHTFPKDANGNYLSTVLKDPKTYTGLCNHYNLTREKIDAAGIDLKDVEEEVKKMLNLGY